MTGNDLPSTSGLAGLMAELPSATLHPHKQMKSQRNNRIERKEKNWKRKDICPQLPLPAPESTTWSAPSLHLLGPQHPNFSSWQEVHHRLIPLVSRKQLGDLQVLASARFLSSFISNLLR
jgi:hypothetical protein